MAKTMAAVEQGRVVNMIWCPDSQGETDTLKSPMERPVGIGDTWEDGVWLRNGAAVLSPLEEAERKNREYEALLEEIEKAMGVAV